MRSRFSVLLAICSLTSFVSCGSPQQLEVKQPEKNVQRNVTVNAIEAGDGAAARELQQLAFLSAQVVRDEVQPQAPPADPHSSATLPALAPEPSSIPWACVAQAETGSDITMTGSVYSTEYGVLNEIVREYASPAVAKKVFAGTASAAEQTDIVERFAADHGTGGWGQRTRAECGL